MMKQILKYMVTVVAMVVFTSMPVQAATMTFYSGDGGDTLVSDISGTGSITTIIPHPVWGDVSATAGLTAGTAEWISYANTGIGGFVAPNVVGRNPGQETMHVRRQFNIANNTDINLWVLADDTAAVRVTGPGGEVDFKPASNAQLDPCSGQVIGCAGQHMGVFNWTGLVGGLYMIDFYQFQTNGDVSGMQFAGSYEQAERAVPEPASMTLLGLGLFGTAMVARRRRHQPLS